MDLPTWIVLGLAGLFVIGSMMYFRESFVPEFLEQGNLKRTAERSQSSYSQQTNHVQPIMGPVVPIDGTQSPFRVNMWNSYEP